MGSCSSRQKAFCPQAKRVESLEELKHLYAGLDTGDVLLFNSASASHAGIRCCTKGEAVWDHVAVVIKRHVSDGPRTAPAVPQLCPAARPCGGTHDRYCTCVSPAEDLVELFEANPDGVHIYPLDEHLANNKEHRYHVAVVKRNAPLDAAQRAAVFDFINQVRGRAYEHTLTGACDLLHAACAVRKGCVCMSDKKDRTAEWVERQQHAMFCSELVAYVLAHAGTLKLAGVAGTPLDEGSEARSFMPQDFCDESRGSHTHWHDHASVSGQTDPSYAPVLLLQYEGSPYNTFLDEMREDLQRDANTSSRDLATYDANGDGVIDDEESKQMAEDGVIVSPHKSFSSRHLIPSETRAPESGNQEETESELPREQQRP